MAIEMFIYNEPSRHLLLLHMRLGSLFKSFISCAFSQPQRKLPELAYQQNVLGGRDWVSREKEKRSDDDDGSSGDEGTPVEC